MELRMSRKERDRLKVLDQLSKKQITQVQAAARLGLSTRQLRRIERRYGEQGDQGLVHRLRGRTSNRQIDPGVQARATGLLKTRYGDFGPTLAAEHLAEEEGIVVSRETVRGWMRQAQLWAGRRRNRPHRRRRARRESFGELIQMDTSEHDWLEGRGAACVLITMIDDATGIKLMRFFSADTTLANMSVILEWIRRFGRPLALYTDWASHFKQTPRRGQKQALKPTQIERALGELGIALIAAHSPQAKGRVERSHGTDQDRLIKKMRLAKISTIEAANEFVEKIYLPQVNARFAVAPVSAADAHRGGEGYDLEAILSIQEERQVRNDYTVQVDGRTWQIERGEIRGGLRRTKVIVERRLDGSLRLRWRDRYLQYHLAEGFKPNGSGASAARSAGGGAASFREGSLRSPSLHCAAPPPAPPQPQKKNPPPHPRGKMEQ
jgi:hypothetical protein